MKEIPDWVKNWIDKDRLVRSKFITSQEYLKKKRKIKEIELNIDEESGLWITAYFMVNRFHIHYDNGIFKCSCSFFKKRLICSHILGICQLTGVWPEKETIFKNNE